LQDTPEQPQAEPPDAPQPAADDVPPTPPAGSHYRVALDSYSGPMDLLLYLIRKNEVDIYDIPIASIAEQYQLHLDAMAEINVNVAGEFLVMAATLMEIKSRMLLPREEEGEEEEEDPRGELVRQLLEYKRYRDIARDLGERAAQQALKYPRPERTLLPGPEQEPEEEQAPDASLDGIGLWELVDAFARVLRETSFGAPQTQMLERERPLHEFRRQLLAIVTEERQVVFSRVFAECHSRDEMVAMFMALLELVRLKRICLQQVTLFGEIYVCIPEEKEAVDQTAAEVRAAHGLDRPDTPPAVPGGAVKQVDILAEIDEEEEALGRARKRIDEAIRRVEGFLKEHHEQMRREGRLPDAQQDAASPPDAAPAPGPQDEPQPNGPEPEPQDTLPPPPQNPEGGRQDA